jgi:hypothetical protein
MELEIMARRTSPNGYHKSLFVDASRQRLNRQTMITNEIELNRLRVKFDQLPYGISKNKCLEAIAILSLFKINV